MQRSRFCLLAGVAIFTCSGTLFAGEIHYSRKAAAIEKRIRSTPAEVTMIGGSYLDDRALEDASKAPNLTRVMCLCHCRITDAGLASIKGHRSISMVGMRGAFTATGLVHLTTLPALEHLRIYAEELDSDHIAVLAKLHTLTYLKVSTRKPSLISEADVNLLRRALPGCRISITGHKTIMPVVAVAQRVR